MPVSALLVSHNGARWLPAVVAGVDAQTTRIDHHVAIDTGSRDESVQILRRNGVWDVEKLDGDPSYAESVLAGLARIPQSAVHRAGETGQLGQTGERDWVWLLHDDSAPDPDALTQLLAAAAEHTDVPIFGAKLREWPSLRRLLELGVTISGNGRRETGLERGEYDQGQHDVRRIVLAANTAGLLVRRDVLEELGFDPALPLYGNDIDFGWRAARAGHSTMMVPEALVFHAEAAHRGLRRGGRAAHRHGAERAAAVQTLMANGPGRALAWRGLRLALGGLLRALGYLLIRAPREAWGEITALTSTLGRPGRLAAARRRRRTTATVPHADVSHLLAPPWLPLRHLLDSLGDFFSALLDLGREAVGGKAVRSAHSVELDDEESSVEPGLVSLLLRNPRLWLALGSVVVALVAARGMLGGGPLHGGALPAAPDGIGHWWGAWASGNHPLGTGTSAPAPAYLLPLAVLGVVALGHAGWVVSVIFVLGVPLTMLSALRFFRRVVPGRVAPVFGAIGFALLPVVSGASAQGRLGTVTGALVLPWVATAALGLRREERDPRWRAVWRTTLGLALLTAFVPSAWSIALLLGLLLLGHGLVRDRSRWRKAAWWAGPVVILLAVPVLLLPWFVGVLGSPGAYLVEAGRATALPTLPGPIDLLLGRPGGPGGAPAWLGAGIVVAGVLAVLRGDTRSRVLLAWTVSAVAAVVLAASSHVVVHLPGVGPGFHPWSGFPLLVVHAGLLTAAVVAGDGLRHQLAETGTGTRTGIGWRRPVAVVGLLAASVGVVGGAAWWVVTGADGPVHRGPVTAVPAYMTDLSDTQPANGVLVLHGGDRGTAVSYQVLRDGALPLGDDAIAALTPPDRRLTATVARLLADPQAEDARLLARFGVAYVYAAAPTSNRVTGAFDAGTGFSRASATSTASASWRLQQSPSLTATDTDGQPLHLLLVLLQAFAIVAGVVLAMPTRRVS